MGTSNDLAYFATKLGFNANLQKKLGLYYTKGSTPTSFKKKILFFFFKPVATFEVLINSTDPIANSPLNVLFTDLLTEAEVIKRTNSWWGVGAPPIYIDKVTYGSSIILTVDYTSTTGPLYEKVNTGSSEMTTEEIQFNLNKIILSTSLKVLSVGPVSAAELAAIKSGNWADYIIQVPNSVTNKVSSPITYTVRDFNQLDYNSSVTFDYMKINCAEGTSDANPTSKGNSSVSSANTANSSSVPAPSNAAANLTTNKSTSSPTSTVANTNNSSTSPIPISVTNASSSTPSPIPISNPNSSWPTNNVPIKATNESGNQTVDNSWSQYKTVSSNISALNNKTSGVVPLA